MKISSTLFFSLLTILSLNAAAHGEDKPGPHGGHIRMPGAFHTEVVKEKGAYRVYLLDVNWKNPSLLDSDVKASIQSGKKKTELTCVKESDSYLCKTSLPEIGMLKIIAKREGQTGGIPSTYNLPLKFDRPSHKMPEHDGH